MNSIQSKLSLVLSMTVLFALESYSQHGYSSASMHQGKMSAEQKRTAASNGMDYFTYALPRPQDVVIEEYFNYHTHQIALPKSGESVALDLQWGNDQLGPNENSAILQIGLATSELNKGTLADAPPVNVSLVIDKSGSMRTDNRLNNAKEAARAFVQRLRPKDHISIIAFDSYVQVLLPSTEVGNQETVLAAIDRITIGGSTDLNSGLIAGYGEVAKAYEKGQSNKVIMLTDALTNTGIVNPSEIVANSSIFNKEYQIDISMVGVGVDFNVDLSRKITENAKSSIYFINDSEDIKKVFIDEVESLLCPVATEAKLVLEFDEGISLDNFFGYQPIIKKNRLELELNNMNRGLTQIFLARFTVENPKRGIPPVVARIEYTDLATNEASVIQGSAHLKNGRQSQINPLSNPEVKKNYAIASMAQAIHDMADHAQKKEYKAAKETVDKTVHFVNEIFDGNYDADVQRVLDILTAYQGDMDLALNTNQNN